LCGSLRRISLNKKEGSHARDAGKRYATKMLLKLEGGGSSTKLVRTHESWREKQEEERETKHKSYWGGLEGNCRNLIELGGRRPTNDEKSPVQRSFVTVRHVAEEVVRELKRRTKRTLSILPLRGNDHLKTADVESRQKGS